MAVFKQEMNWSTYQEKQLKVLQSLEASFTKSLRTSALIGDSLTSISKAVNVIANNIVNNFSQKTQAAGNIIIGAANHINDAYRNQAVILDQHGEILKDINEELDKEREAREKAAKEEEKERQERSQAIDSVINDLTASMSKLGRAVDNISTITNSIMQFTGVSYGEMQSFRADVSHDILVGLNRDTGNKFSNQQILSTMAAVSNAGIGNMDTLKELTRPIMLASESMDVNIGGLSKLLGRWHTRYSFNSAAMEEVVNDIRSSTAGNQATAEATLANITTLGDIIEFASGGDEDKMLGMTEAVADLTAYAESMGMDSSVYTQYLKDISLGEAHTDPYLATILNRAGYDTKSAQDMFLSGEEGAKQIGIALMEAEKSLMQELVANGGVDLLSQVATSYGTNADHLLQNYNALTSANAVSFDEFLANLDTTTAAEAVDQQYVSFQDKVKNNLSRVTTTLASIQESLGFGLSDIAVGIIALQGIGGKLGGLSGIKGLLSKIGSALGVGGAAAGGGSAGGALAGAAAAVGGTGGLIAIVGAAAAAIGTIVLIAKGISSSLETVAELEQKTYDKTFGSKSFVSDLDVGEKIVYERKVTADGIEQYTQKSVSMEEYNSNKDMYDALEKDYLNASLYKEGNDKDMTKFEKWWDKNTRNSFGTYLVNAIKYGSDNTLEAMRANPNEGMISIGYRLSKQETLSRQKDFEQMIMNDPALLETYKAYNFAGVSVDNSEEHDQLIEDIINKDLANKLLNEKLVYIKGKWYPTSEMDEFSAQGYEVGTNYISHNQLAYLHEGEAVVPKRYNPMANITELEMLREKVKETTRSSSNEQNRITETTLKTLIEIKEFLAEWQESNDRREDINQAKSRFGLLGSVVSQYGGSY